MLQQTLQNVFGLTAFRAGQEAVIQGLMAGRSSLAVFPTGGGKSLCYQLPGLLLPGLTLVISPLIALMKDQVAFLCSKGVNAAALNSSLSAEEVQRVYQDLANGQLKFLYLAPERLSSEALLQRLQQVQVSLIAIDEAHCISEWGHNFRPEYLRIAKVAQRMQWQLVLALTATATTAVAADICRAFRIATADFHQSSFHRENLFLQVTPCPREAREEMLLSALTQAERFPAVVYVTLQQTAEQVATFLQKRGLKARAYHAGLPDEVRSEVQESFMSDALQVIVATIAFGMGIDKSNVRCVMHYNLPKSLENYQQEIGRAGRAGQASHCEVLACLDDLRVLQNFVYGDTPSESSLRQLLDHLLRQGSEFSISRYELSHGLDIRPMVLETVLTYLELEGLLQPLGATYSTFQFYFLQPQAQILAGHTPERQQFLQELFGLAKKATKWYTLEVEAAAIRLNCGSDRILKALNWLAEAQEIVLKPSGLLHRFQRLIEQPDRQALTLRMQELFALRESNEQARLAKVVELFQQSDCLTRQLLQYFGESLAQPCGHCCNCIDRLQQRRVLPVTSAAEMDMHQVQQIQTLIQQGHAALRNARQITRFLCGISSPATSRARLTRHDEFGLLSEQNFEDVLQHVQSLISR